MKIIFQRTAGILLLFLLFAGGESAAQQLPITNEGIVILETPADTASLAPKLIKGKDGQIFLSWTTRNADGSATLHTSSFLNEQWTPAQPVAQGDNWFINWADFPTLAAHNPMHMAASYLTKSAGGTYTYDVRLTTTLDGGATWTAGFVPHRDNVAAEHGFVSLLPWADNQFKAVWLDGRFTVGGSHGAGAKHRAMTLRSAVFDAHGALSEEHELDNRVCDCCQTAAVKTGPASALVAYRDRSNEEIRDIAVVRYANGAWQSPEVVHADGWQIAGCPVNGPALDAADHTVAMAWFTAAQDSPRVQFSISTDGGQQFGKPVLIAAQRPAGRVGVALLDERSAVVTWLQPTANGEATINAQYLTWVDPDNVTRHAPAAIAQTKSSRQSGFPQIIAHNDQIIFAWTEVLPANQTIVRSARLKKSDALIRLPD